MVMPWRALALCLAGAIVQGCASSSADRIQVLSLRAQNEDGGPVAQARCTLKNDKGAWQATAPAQVAVIGSATELSIQCQKQGMRDGRLRVVSYPVPAMFGIRILGHEAEAAGTEGAMYRYPEELQVMMGASVFLERRPR